MQKDKVLKIGLTANAIFSTICGVLFLFWTETVDTYAAVGNSLVITVIGVGLLIFAADILHQVTRSQLSISRARLTTISDMAWVLGTVILLFIWPEVVNESGADALILIALVVLMMALVQLVGMRWHSARTEG